MLGLKEYATTAQRFAALLTNVVECWSKIFSTVILGNILGGFQSNNQDAVWDLFDLKKTV